VKILVRNRLVVGAALFLLVSIGLMLFLSLPGEARGSVLSRGPGGWLAARKYLEAQGARVKLLDGPLDSFQEGGVLVVAFPWQGGVSAEAGDHLEQHLRRGGDLVLAYSGEAANPGELVALEGLGLPLQEVRKVVLNPVRWRKFAREEWDLQPTKTIAGETEPVRVWAPRWAPRWDGKLPKGAQVLLRSPRGPAAVMLPRYRGRIWILPADAFANARLTNPGNADLLETLRQRLGDRWTFDEYHHGLAGRRAVEAAEMGRTLDLILLHLAVLYVVALLTLSRRFGPAWSEPPVVTGSAGSFLLGLGALHHRLGHHAEAARRLLERTRELDRNLVLPDDFDRRAANAGPRELVELARELARLRHPRGGRPALREETERETAA
jgi:hypothetical protein